VVPEGSSFSSCQGPGARATVFADTDAVPRTPGRGHRRGLLLHIDCIRPVWRIWGPGATYKIGPYIFNQIVNIARK
jgi:hypothetical protein